MPDTKGKPWATKLKVGDKVRPDGGFSCLGPETKAVLNDVDGLYIECAEGKHHLEPSLNEHGEYVGLYPA